MGEGKRVATEFKWNLQKLTSVKDTSVVVWTISEGILMTSGRYEPDPFSLRKIEVVEEQRTS
jgi:hypothetical protein